MNFDDIYQFDISPNALTDDVTYQLPSFLDAPPRGPESISAFMSSTLYPDYQWEDDPPLKAPDNSFQTTYVNYTLTGVAPSPQSLHTQPILPAPVDESTLNPNQAFDPGPSNHAQSKEASKRMDFAAPTVLEPMIYSETGFDMLSILSRVATRPNPQITLGPVDFTCSFVVVDAQAVDEPIVYASPTFAELTGYSLPEIVGRNCRFLQSPTGQVRKGETRRFTDDGAVTLIRKSLDGSRECQTSLINYRKNGDSFINLLTVIPIKWDGDKIRYHVGFQVDLERQPSAILKTMADGSYVVNYSNINGPEARSPQAYPPISGRLQRILREPGGSINEEQERADLHKILLDHSDDFIHVLSLKGSIQYVSASVTNVLEYTPEELHGKNILDITHPSDVVPVTRELKESSSHSPPNAASASILAKHYIQQQKLVHLLFRVRRKHSGYVWIESTGRLQVEQGKGRKSIVFSGRIRHMPDTTWGTVSRGVGLSDSDCWCQVSVHGGLFLVVSAGAQNVLGRLPDEVRGTRIRDWVGAEWKQAIDQVLLKAASTSPSPSEPHQITCVRAERGDTPPHVIIVSIYPPETATQSARPSSLICHISFPPNNPLQPHSHDGPTILSDAQSSEVPISRIIHPLSSNVLEELDTTRGTSWQYELQQLKIANAKMRAEIEAITAAKSGSSEPGRRKRQRLNESG